MILKFNGTTKRCGHLVEVELANKEDNTYLRAIQNQTGGTAAEYASTIKEAMAVVGVDVEQVTNTTIVIDSVLLHHTKSSASFVKTD